MLIDFQMNSIYLLYVALLLYLNDAADKEEIALMLMPLRFAE
jgi:hypothetical protein